MHQSEQETHTRDTAVAMGNLTSATSIREALHSTLKVLENINECALVDYPQYPNVGSHLLWLSEVMYLTEVMNIKIKYLSTLRRYSDSDMQDAIGDQPILLRSGYLGDFWDGSHGDRRRLIYEHIIGHFTNNPIYIMPQSINYRDPAKLDNAKRIINSHPNVTIIARENDSYNFAKEHFHKCHICLSPDIVFHLAGKPGLDIRTESRSSVLYLRRSDWDSDGGITRHNIGIDNLEQSDWSIAHRVRNLSRYRLVRKLWQQHLAPPGEFASRCEWRIRYPYARKLKKYSPPPVKFSSWNIIFSGLYQLNSHPLIITNRLHGHVLSLLLDIPHILLPGPYNKMESFYKTWTHQVPTCCYVGEYSRIKSVAEELLHTKQQIGSTHHQA